MVSAVVRVRAGIHVKPDIKRTLELLRLTRVNHCALIDDQNENYQGMLTKAKDFITWGELDKETAANLIKSRGKLRGGKPITDEYIKSATSYGSMEKLAEGLVDNKVSYDELPEVKPVLRLHPPRKGYRSIKNPWSQGGAVGYRGKEINTLIKRML